MSATFRLFYEKAQGSGKVDFRADTSVKRIVPRGGHIDVITDRGSFTADKVVIAAGPYTNDVTSSLGFELDIIIWQMVSCYFKKKHPDVDFPSWYAFGAPQPWYDPGVYYGFEEVGYSNPGYIRVAPAFAMHRMQHPKERTDRPNDLDLQMTSQWVAKHMPGLDAEPRFKSSCMAALPADGNKKMFLDFAPVADASRDIVIFSSGWAFKYTPVVGLACAELALKGETQFDINPFRIPRPDEPVPKTKLAEAIRKTSRYVPY